ncbi:MAG: nucleotidyltransferase family protein [Armatimonadetes bacterium]|nr:nucleotidyltransferase family protein [Armatimonadota bacterium]
MTSGVLQAYLLAGAWLANETATEPPITQSEWERVASPLLRTGSGPLAWWRMRFTALRESPPAPQFQDAYRAAALQSLLQSQALEQLGGRFQEYGVRPLLVKGWGVARHYPEAGLRPYDDFDFLVRPAELPAARQAVGAAWQVARVPVELHDRFNFPFDLTLEQMFSRAETASLGPVQLLVPAPEDHLRLLCFHMLYHGAWRPLWLCDLAVMLWTHPNLDPRRLLTGDASRDAWVTHSLLLARDVLGAELPPTLAEWLPPRPPGWLVSALLAQWGRGTGSSTQASLGKALRYAWPNPRRLLEVLRLRWQNPIEASLEVGAPCDESLRFPIQLRAAGRRLGDRLRRR